ncbi:MAG: prepilin-type N-terminal cleavage/methylation domain-containing protein [Candidatus Omnitrophica bacterium]|nr:prepilin-type N-terminal cleavage/methylation domain-containing protein [Candidatus Omnitrophota bacterium]
MMNRKGLTLLELILALTMLSMIFLAATTLNVSSVRLTAAVGDEVRLQNELQYVLRDIENNIVSGKNPVTTGVPNCPSGAQCLQVTDPDENRILYIYKPTPAPSTISRVIVPAGGGNSTTQILSQGVLIPKTGKSLFEIPSGTDNLVQINITARLIKVYGGVPKIIRLPGITKSILLRGV